MYLIFEGQPFDHASEQGRQMAALWSRTGGNGAVKLRQEDAVLMTHVCSPVSMREKTQNCFICRQLPIRINELLHLCVLRRMIDAQFQERETERKTDRWKDSFKI